MKDFFQEYGKLIIVGALVILVLMFSTPFGQAITTSIAGFTAGFAQKNNSSLEEVYIGPRPIIDGTNVVLTDVDGDGVASKGDTITFAREYLYSGSNTGPTEFLVLKSDGSTAELMAKTNYQNSKFNASSVTTTDSARNTVQKYEGGTLDALLNETYYNTLSDTIKGKIQSKSITQNSWYYTSSALADPDATIVALNGSTYKYKKNGTVGTYSRNVYALDVQDVVDYIGTNGTGADLNNMFFGTPSTVTRYAWLRSANSSNGDGAFGVSGGSGGVYYFGYGSTREVRPAFTIALN